MEKEITRRITDKIETTFEFVSRIYYDYKAGRNSEEYSEEEFPLPVNVKGVMKDCVRYIIGKQHLQHMETLSTLDDCARLRFLEKYFRQSFAALDNYMNNAVFIAWITLSWVTALQYQEAGIEEGPPAAGVVLHSKCLENEKYYGLRIFGDYL